MEALVAKKNTKSPIWDYLGVKYDTTYGWGSYVKKFVVFPNL